MPEIIDLFKDETGYGDPTFTSIWQNVSTSNSIVLTATANVNYTASIRWATNDSFFVIATDTLTELANVSSEFNQPIKARFLQIHMTFVSNPVDWSTQLFFFD